MMLPQTVEEKIVWDADGLDGMGLIGILRDLVAEEGSIEEILTDRMQRWEGDYDKLYFEESWRIKERLQTKTVKVIKSFREAVDKQAEQIAYIEWPVEGTSNER
jgi:hypothetical protein